eukprot:gene4117-21534_t
MLRWLPTTSSDKGHYVAQIEHTPDHYEEADSIGPTSRSITREYLERPTGRKWRLYRLRLKDINTLAEDELRRVVASSSADLRAWVRDTLIPWYNRADMQCDPDSDADEMDADQADADRDARQDAQVHASQQNSVAGTGAPPASAGASPAPQTAADDSALAQVLASGAAVNASTTVAGFAAAMKAPAPQPQGAATPAPPAPAPAPRQPRAAAAPTTLQPQPPPAAAPKATPAPPPAPAAAPQHRSRRHRRHRPQHRQRRRLRQRHRHRLRHRRRQLQAKRRTLKPKPQRRG